MALMLEMLYIIFPSKCLTYSYFVIDILNRAINVVWSTLFRPINGVIACGIVNFFYDMMVISAKCYLLYCQWAYAHG